MAKPIHPAEIAREAIRRLASSRKPPTPENFRSAYLEVTGEAVDVKEQEEKPSQGNAANPGESHWADVLRSLFRQWDAQQAGLTHSRKREMMERVLINFGHDDQLLHEKMTAMANSWAGSMPSGSVLDGELPVEEAAVESHSEADKGQETAVHAMIAVLAGHLHQLATSCERRWPDLAQRADKLGRGMAGKDALQPEEFTAWSMLWHDFLMRAEDEHELSAGLKRLVGLLFLNIGELLDEGPWLAGQLQTMQNLMAQDLQADALLQAEHSLRELAYKQGVIKGSMDEARSKLKTLITTFIDHIGEMSRSADGYHTRIGMYSEKISRAADIGELGDVVQGLSDDVAGLRGELGKSHTELLTARGQVEKAQARIHELEQELAQVSNLVREDQLTGALNRRGLDEALARELARSERLAAPLSIGLMDIDHFKKLNDSLGHQAGDEALRYLARMVRGLLRPTDILARYGGEEFLVLLPNTGAKEAAEVFVRLQRALTKEIFLHEHDRILITFSAGVVERRPDEAGPDMIARADTAMYRAKQSGRNRVELG